MPDPSAAPASAATEAEVRDPGRRNALKIGSATAAALLTRESAQAQVVIPQSQLIIARGRIPSPPNQPWIEELIPQKPMVPLGQLTPAATRMPQSGEGRVTPHQAWADAPPVDYYEFTAKPSWHSFYYLQKPQLLWTFNNQVPGPLIHARYGRAVVVRYRNEIAKSERGPGSPEISIHLHNGHTPSESDGHPDDFFAPHFIRTRSTAPGYTGAFKDSHYPMRYGGYRSLPNPPPGWIGDPREALGTLWYHDHRHHFTATNVYRGLAGFFLAFDHIDSGNEKDTNPQALCLPSGDYDIPLMLQDKQFDVDGNVAFDAMDPDGFVGDKFMVNGKVQPFLRVAPRKYRFRLLCAATARVVDVQIRLGNQPEKFMYISNDGNLLEESLEMRNVQLAPAERGDIVVDFTDHAGKELYLVNRMQMLDGRKPEKDSLRAPIQMLKFVVDRPLTEPDVSRVPRELRKLPITQSDREQAISTAVRRRANLGRSGGAWTINDRIYSSKPSFQARSGDWELWEVRNESGGWVHPVHIHLEEGYLISRNGRTPPMHERGRKDVFLVNPNERLQILIRFRDFTGKYVTHCHNTLHEDHGMMENFEVVAS